MKKVIFTLSFFSLIVLVGAYFYLQNNLHLINDAVKASVEKATGKQMMLEKTSISFLPKISLNLENGSWGSEKDELSLAFKMVSVKLELLPLIQQEVKIEGIVVDTPTIIYNENNKKQVLSSSEIKSVGQSTAGSNFINALSLKELNIVNGTVKVIQKEQNIDLSNLNFTINDFEFDKTASFSLASAIKASSVENMDFNVEFGGNIHILGDSYKLTNLKGKLDDTSFDGDISINMPKAAVLSVDTNLNFGTLNINKYLVEKSAEPTAQNSSQKMQDSNAKLSDVKTHAQKKASNIILPNVNANITIAELQVDKINISNISAKLNTNADKLNIEPCSFVIYDAKSNLKFNSSLNDLKHKLELTITDLNVAKALEELANNKDVSGNISITSQLDFAGQDEASIKQSLNGVTQINGKAKVSTKVLPELAQAILKDKEIDFTEITSVINAKNGVLVINPLIANSKISQSSGSGEVNLNDESINMAINSNFAGLQMPLLIEGTISKPIYRIEEKPVEGLLKDALDSGVNILKGGDTKENLDKLKESGKSLLKKFGF